MERVNRALAYFDASTILFDAHVRSYTEPVGIPVSPTFARGAAEEATVIVRTGHGVVGMKHSLSDEELAGGGIPWRVGISRPKSSRSSSMTVTFLSCLSERVRAWLGRANASGLS